MITIEEIENIALLSKLFINENEMQKLADEMQKIINFADEINEACESDCEFDDINNLSNAFREDIVKESFDKDDILKNANDVEKDHFLVRKRA